MPPRVYATIGRSRDNDVVLDHPTVSNHHARLSWLGGSLLVEDLSSQNGTFVDGQAIKRAKTRAGVEIRVGAAIVPWSHEGLRKLLKAGAGTRTLGMPQGRVSAYVCGACGYMGTLSSPLPDRMTCESCKTTLHVGTKPEPPKRSVATTVLLLLLVVASTGAASWWWRTQNVQLAPTPVVRRMQETLEAIKPVEHIGGATAAQLAKALTPMDPVTRNAAVKLAARTQGPFHVEQVAEIWSAVRKEWRYVNDPVGREYFATATETIENGYVGDCDDFAITLTSMVTAIGGNARVVLMDGPRGGHAYAEACVQGDPKAVARALRVHYRTRWRRYLSGKAPSEIAYRTSDDCPIWLNLDWNSNVPGGPYEPEKWAVAIYEEGRREQLTPAAPATSSSE